ncbi:hypothetical protein PR048_001961 [Dryococelus australis]|uniref:Retrovirus-related Pol polyprotein from transposon TNT 1-94-like beta-barrel domain-containing protein n=1 Tax=Dryococelus australis TaxID=614101 RepID=A0ABQ9IJJ7_9NEOP|nr:hypothetical protein PR048_001961 [Dryococelus australis]
MKPKLYVSEKTVNTKEPKCFDYGKVGHIKKYCPEDSSSDKTKAYSSDKDEDLLIALNTPSENLNEWYVNSGVTSQITTRKDWLIDFKDNSQIKVTANDESVLSEGVCNVEVKTLYGNKVIQDTVLIHGIKANLLCVSKIVEKGHSVVFDERKCTIYSDDIILATATK